MSTVWLKLPYVSSSRNDGISVHTRRRLSFWIELACLTRECAFLNRVEIVCTLFDRILKCSGNAKIKYWGSKQRTIAAPSAKLLSKVVEEVGGYTRAILIDVFCKHSLGLVARRAKFMPTGTRKEYLKSNVLIFSYHTIPYAPSPM